ncbi:hypothetical protein LguiA_002210 [Lonicera macranthoides]
MHFFSCTFQAKSFFTPALLNSLENILVLDHYLDSNTIASILLRDSGRKNLKGDLVIYLFDTTLCEALKISSDTPVTVNYGKAIKSWIDDIMVQVLNNNRYGMEQEQPTVYVDGLVGTNTHLDPRQEVVKKRPHIVVLFCQVESADCNSYNTLLRILENGILTRSGEAWEIDIPYLDSLVIIWIMLNHEILYK